MKAEVLVSIIINNYNYDRFLAEAIDSALNQTYPNVEVIVVDDGSIDRSREIINTYGDRVVAIFQENGKQGAAFNSGFAASQGEIIIFLDSDDYLYPTAVEKIAAVWCSDAAKVHYRLTVVDGDRQPLGYSYPQGRAPLSEGEVWRVLLEKGSYVSTPTSGNALNRTVLNQLFPIPAEYKLTADDYLSILVPFSGKVLAIEEPLGAYRIHGSNQWAMASVKAERFQRFVRHDLQNYALLTQKAQELGYVVPTDLEQRSIGRIQSRLISLRLNSRDHPVSSDRSIVLTYQALRSIWKYSGLSWQKSAFYSLLFLSIGLLPLPIARPVITWHFAPHFRPKLMKTMLHLVRPLLN